MISTGSIQEVINFITSDKVVITGEDFPALTRMVNNLTEAKELINEVAIQQKAARDALIPKVEGESSVTPIGGE